MPGALRNAYCTVINFRGAPLNHENIGIYEARRRADVHSGNKRCKINNYIIIFDLECGKKRFCRVRGKDLRCVGHPLTCRQKCHTGGRITPHCVCKLKLSSNYIEKSGARIRCQRARKRRTAKITIQ